jgi:hypothetical protein
MPLMLLKWEVSHSIWFHFDVSFQFPFHLGVLSDLNVLFRVFGSPFFFFFLRVHSTCYLWSLFFITFWFELLQ